MRGRDIEGLWDVDDPAWSSQEHLEQVRSGQDADDLTEAQGRDREVIAADAQDRQAQECREHHGKNDRERDGLPERQPGDAVLGGGGQQGDRVCADRVERDEAQIQQAGQAQGDVQSEAQQDEQGHDRDDLSEEWAHRDREEQHHDAEQDRQWPDHQATLVPRQRLHALLWPARADDGGDRAARDEDDDRSGDRQAFRSEQEPGQRREWGHQHGCPQQPGEQAEEQ